MEEKKMSDEEYKELLEIINSLPADGKWRASTEENAKISFARNHAEEAEPFQNGYIEGYEVGVMEAAVGVIAVNYDDSADFAKYFDALPDVTMLDPAYVLAIYARKANVKIGDLAKLIQTYIDKLIISAKEEARNEPPVTTDEELTALIESLPEDCDWNIKMEEEADKSFARGRGSYDEGPHLIPYYHGYVLGCKLAVMGVDIDIIADSVSDGTTLDRVSRQLTLDPAVVLSIYAKKSNVSMGDLAKLIADYSNNLADEAQKRSAKALFKKVVGIRWCADCFCRLSNRDLDVAFNEAYDEVGGKGKKLGIADGKYDIPDDDTHFDLVPEEKEEKDKNEDQE